MAGEKLSKKLPDRARKSHPKHAKRMGHREKAAKRHAANRAANEAARAANDVYRAAGLPTPYETRQHERRLRHLHSKALAAYKRK